MHWCLHTSQPPNFANIYSKKTNIRTSNSIKIIYPFDVVIKKI